MVRPVLEYGDVIYDNCPTHLKLLLESVQRKAALICTGAYRHTENNLLLHDLAWQPLSDRRLSHKLTLFYKVYHGIYPGYLYTLLPPKYASRYNMRENREFKIVFHRLNITRGSFFPSTAKVWNTLSPPVKNAESVLKFKKMCSDPIRRPNRFYLACTGKEGIWITRMRLGLSPLNSHRFTYHLTDHPYCPHCDNVPETIEHFFLFCPHYATARTVLYQALQDIGVNTRAYSEVISEILHGLNYMKNPDYILTPVSTFLKNTNRFR